MKPTLYFIVLIFISATVNLSCKGVVSDEEESKLQQIEYTESDEIITNPERGFYSYYAFSSSKSDVLSAAIVKNQRKAGRSLLLNLYYLNDFRDKAISEHFLNRIETNMKALRKGGSKCILRFAYTSDLNDTPWDAPQEIVLQHVNQLKPLLREYSDVIYVMEAGFIGVWGEWYYTTHFNKSPSSNEDYVPRRALLDALLKALPEERMICVRTPRFKLKCFGIGPADTISFQTAYNKSDLSRIAAHNDCFLATANDMGTFDNDKQRTFWENDSKYVVMGGETCGVSGYSTCENALRQMEKFHWSYLNAGYHGTVLGNWRTDGCYKEIERRLGYRFVLTEAFFTAKPQAGKNITAKIHIKNIGFAALANPRGLEVILTPESGDGKQYIIKPENDPRYWLPGNEHIISFSYKLPAETAGKTYNLYLHLPDPEPTLYGRPEYSIQLANKRVWDNNTGYNKLHSIKIV